MLIFTISYMLSMIAILFFLTLMNRWNELHRSDAAKLFWVAFVPLLNVAVVFVFLIVAPVVLVIEWSNSTTIQNRWNSFMKWMFPNE